MLAVNEEKAVMRQLRLHRPVPVVLVACVAIGLGGMTSARADIISSSPSLPVLDVPYTSAVGAGCFPLAGFCITAGALTLTAPVTSNIVGSNQDITTGASYSGELTTYPGGTPITPVNLTGTIEQEVLGRTSNTETGTWVTDITSLSLSGTVDGYPLDLTLDLADPSTGSTSITSLGGGQGNQGGSLYDISSFFDVFVDLTYHTPTPLHVTKEITGEIGVPEPASLVLLAAPLLALAVARRRRPG
jgi:hypothetical protein